MRVKVEVSGVVRQYLTFSINCIITWIRSKQDAPLLLEEENEQRHAGKINRNIIVSVRGAETRGLI